MAHKPSHSQSLGKAGHGKSRQDASSAGIGGLVDSVKARAQWNERHDPYTDESVPGFENDNIRYLDARPLTRPFTLPESVSKRMLPFLIAAAVIGALILFWYFDTFVNASARQAAQIEENIKRDVSLQLPELSTLMPLSDADVMATLQGTGETLFEKSPIGTEPEGGFEVVKLPQGVSLTDAAASYAAGLDHISAASATRLLNGAWLMTVTRKAGTDMYVGYADFKSHEAQAAIAQALASQGIATTDVADSGVDQLGNTYSAGTLTVDGNTYNWRVSVVPLESMYSIRDMPEDAQYVGIRFTT